MQNHNGYQPTDKLDTNNPPVNPKDLKLQPVHQVFDGIFNTASFGTISLHAPNPENISIDDIATGLSNICRFGGQINQFYSVAQHSCLVACIAPDELKSVALLHDASEAYIGDIIKPLKVLLGDTYATIEDRFMKVIFDKYGLDIELLPEIKEFDTKLLEVEHEFFFGIDKTKLFRITDDFFPNRSVVWDHYASKTEFLKLFHRYFNH